MAVYLVQHGKSLPKEKDPAKGLSDTGRQETMKIADVALMYQVPVSNIVHSGKTRAEQTARIFRDILKVDATLEKMDGIGPIDDVTDLGGRIDPASNMIIVGHLPYMERLVSFLTAGNPDLHVIRFQNSGIVCLDRDENGWFIKWALNPHIG
jgi:phosphohistidine phosphatase